MHDIHDNPVAQERAERTQGTADRFLPPRLPDLSRCFQVSPCHQSRQADSPHHPLQDCRCRSSYPSQQTQTTCEFEFDDTRAVVDFIVNYAEANAILLPGRTPGHWKCDVNLLLNKCTKKTVFMQYCSAADAAGTRKVALRMFRRL